MDIVKHQVSIDTLRQTCLSHDRPEVRAKTCIDLFALLDQHYSSNTTDQASFSDNSDTLHDNEAIWSIILIGLSDSWPLVSQAFLEQMQKHYGPGEQTPSSATLSDRHIFGSRDLDKILTWTSSSSYTTRERLRVAAGSLVLAKKWQVSKTSFDAPFLSNQSAALVANMVSQGWQESYDPRVEKASEDASRALQLLVQTFPNTRLITTLGKTTSFPPNLEKTSICIEFYRTALNLAKSRGRADSTDDIEATPVDTIKDWTLVHWMCDQLQIPTWFESRAQIHETSESMNRAKLFASNVARLIECLDMLLDMQKMDNSFTVHKALIAGASFTNPADTWMSPTLLSPGSLTLESIAHKFLRHIQDSTPWTLPSTSSSLPSLQYPKGTILIPGTFSDNVMQVLDQTRIYFTNRRASQMNERVKVVVDAHQQTLRMQRLTGPDDPSQNQPTAIVPLRTAGVRPKFKIADAGDEAIELDEQHLVHATGAMTVQSQQHDTPLHHPRWDQDRLESLAVVEWCTQQRVDDPTKIQPMLMMLLAPILACIESNVLRFQVRALQLLKQFLTMYHPTFASLDKKEEDLSQDNAQHAAIDDQTGTLSSAPFTRGTTMHTPSRTRSLRAGGDPLIWVKIFERTGLDQVFARALRPLMHPLRPQADAGTVPGAGSGDFVLEPGVSAHQAIDEELDMVQTAFQTYLVLMAVSTETGIGMEKDEDASDGQSVSQRQRYQTQSQGQKQDEPLLSVEELFVAGILGSTLTVNPSDQYRMLILDWMRILIEENIERRDLVKRGSGTSSTTALTVSTDGGEEPVFVLRGLGRRTIKHLPAVVRFTCEMLELPVPTMPWSKTDLEALAVTNNKRKLRLELLRRAAESLRVLLRVTRARIWRYRGRVLTAIATCWANSRLPGPASPVSSPSPDSPQVNSSSGHPGLDQILIESARLLYDTCRDHSPQARTGIQELRGGRPEDESVVLTAEDGLKKDIACLQQLDPAVFGPLFAWHHSGPSSFPPHSS